MDLIGLNGGYQDELVDHRLTEREWADEWKHLDHVRIFSYLLILILNITNNNTVYVLEVNLSRAPVSLQ